MKPTGQKIGWIVIVILIVMWIAIKKTGYTPSPSDSKHSANTTIFLPISTDGWSYRRTEGRKFKIKAVIVNGISLRIRVTTNNITNHSVVLESGVDKKLGEESDIKVLFFRLEPNQGYDSASVKIELFK